MVSLLWFYLTVLLLLLVFPVTLAVMSALQLRLLVFLSRNPALLSSEGAVRGGGALLTSSGGQELRPSCSALLEYNGTSGSTNITMCQLGAHLR